MGLATEDDIIAHDDPMLAELLARCRHVLEESTRLTADELRVANRASTEDESQIRAFVHAGTGLLNVARLDLIGVMLGFGQLVAVALSEAAPEEWPALFGMFEQQMDTALEEIARRKSIAKGATRQ